MAAQKIILVFGAGKNIGQSLARHFKAADYKVALVSRSADDGQITPEGYLTIKADLKNTSLVPKVFDTVKQKLGGVPSVVVYNAASLTPPKDPKNLLTVPIGSFEDDLAVQNTSAYIAAREAVAGFEGLDKDTKKAFIYTGNRLSAVIAPVPIMTTLGIGKSAASYWVGSASAIFKEKDYKFYFADERTADGSGVPLADLSGEAAAEFYLDLVNGTDPDIPWHATYVAGKGFVDFPTRRK